MSEHRNELCVSHHCILFLLTYLLFIDEDLSEIHSF